MASRVRPPRRKVELLHDGDRIEAESGETLAHALIGADRLALSRSPKLHRPRGPYCLRAACEGCLVRLDGMPNVMACRHRVIGGEAVETQNVLGGRTLDLLQAADFIFPHGFDHHRVFAGIPGVSGVVTRLARRIAGLGRLPEQALPIRTARVREVEALVIGGGRAGLAVAERLGPRALLVDDGLELGGALRLTDSAKGSTLLASTRRAGAELEGEATALGLYRHPDPDGRRVALVAGKSGVTLVYPRAVVLAPGGHEALPPFSNNDLPGVFSARAGMELLRAGIWPGECVALVGRGAFAQALEAELGPRVALRIQDPSRVEQVHGRQRVSAVTLNDAKSRRKHRVDALLFEALESPAVELLVQAGGRVSFDAARGYVPILERDGQGAESVWCTGRVTGNPDVEFASARAVAERVMEALTAHRASTA